MAYVFELLLPNCISFEEPTAAALVPVSVMSICVVAADDVKLNTPSEREKVCNSSTVNDSAVVIVTTNVIWIPPPVVLSRENDALPTGVFEVGVKVHDFPDPLNEPPLVQVKVGTSLVAVNTIDFILYVLETLDEIIKVPVVFFAICNLPDDAVQLEPSSVMSADLVGTERISSIVIVKSVPHTCPKPRKRRIVAKKNFFMILCVISFNNLWDYSQKTCKSTINYAYVCVKNRQIGAIPHH